MIDAAIDPIASASGKIRNSSSRAATADVGIEDHLDFLSETAAG